MTKRTRRPDPPILPSIYFFISAIPPPDSNDMSYVSLHFGRDGYACKMKETDRCVFSCIYIHLIPQYFFGFVQSACHLSNQSMQCSMLNVWQYQNFLSAFSSRRGFDCVRRLVDAEKEGKVLLVSLSILVYLQTDLAAVRVGSRR